MQDQVPEDIRPAFVVGADMFSVLVLVETGFRAFQHGDGREILLTARGFMSSFNGLLERNMALAISLKACAADIEQNITDNLSTRVKAMVIEERELAGPVAMSEVLAARGEILRAVHTLIDSGDFSPARSGEEMVD